MDHPDALAAPPPSSTKQVRAKAFSSSTCCEGTSSKVEGQETTTKKGMHRVTSSFRETLHSFCVNFTDAVDAPSGGEFSTMTNDELVRGAMFQCEQLLLHP